MAFKIGNNTVLTNNEDGTLENLSIDGVLVLDGDNLGNVTLQNVIFDTSSINLSSLTTDNILEGTSNLYYTDARVNSLVSPLFLAAETDRISIRQDFASADALTLATAQAYTDSVVSTGIVNITTDDVPEGLNNHYFTNSRINDYLSDNHYATITDVTIAESDANSYTDAREAAITSAYTSAISAASSSGSSGSNAYTDQEVANAISTSNNYTNTQISQLSNTYYNKTESDNKFVNLSGDVMTGHLTLNSAPTSINHAATKAYVDNAVSTGTGALDTDSISEGTLNLYYTDARVDARIPTAVSSFTNDSGYVTSGNPISAFVNDSGYITNSDVDLTGYATESYVDTAVANVIDSAPAALDTLNELSAALGNDANFATTISTQIGTKADASDLLTKVSKSGDTITGDLSFGNNNKINLGTNDNLQLYSTGSNGLIFNNSGDLYFYNNVDDRNIIFRTDNGSGGTTNYIIANGATGGVELNHYGNEKLTTTASGISVTGSIEISATPSLNTHAATKAYVDNAVSTGTGALDTDNVPEGTTNLYYTDARVDARIPTAVSSFTNDAGYLTAHQDLSAYALQTQLFSGSYTDLTNTPTIPTNNNELTNGAGYTTFNSNQATDTTSVVTFDRIVLNSTTDASATSTTHGLQVGTTAGQNIIVDTNEVMARDNGVVSGLHLNADGGDVTINNNLTDKVTFSEGFITATGDVTAYSDRALKRNIQTIENALEKVTEMRGVTFLKDGRASLGVIAQEVETVIPEVVRQDDYGMRSVAYGNIVGVLIEAIKEQQKQIEILQSEIANLKK